MRSVVVRLLGPWEVNAEDRPVVVPAGRLRALLTSLALTAGTPVGLDLLTEQLWPERPPVRARNTLHTYLGRLRKLLGPGVLRTHPAGGYLLDAAQVTVDVHRFRDLLARADAADDAVTELTSLREALALWRGRPFADMHDTWLNREVLPRLTEDWFAATGRRIDLELAAGRPERLVAELRGLTSRFPTREALWLRLITALHLAGRRAEALAAYQHVRRVLSDELGIDPSEQLVALQRTVLLDGTDGGAVVPAPRQLPHAVPVLTGRATELAALDTALDRLDGTAPVIVSIGGPPGVGKTALAVHWAHRVAHRCPDGELYLDLRGHGPGEPVAPAEAAEALLRALGVHSDLVPDDPEARYAALRTAMAGRRVLVLLDGARDSDQVRPLLPGTSALVVVTSRNQLRGLSVRNGAHRVTVGGLAPEESLELLASAVGAARVAAEPRAARRLAELCDHVPLALAIAAERVHRADTLAEVAAALEGARLDALTSGDDDPHSDVRAALSWSYRVLGTEAATMFRVLGSYPAGEVEARAAAAGVPVAAALDQLVAEHLVVRRPSHHYAMSDLIRRYAEELAATVSTSDLPVAAGTA